MKKKPKSVAAQSLAGSRWDKPGEREKLGKITRERWERIRRMEAVCNAVAELMDGDAQELPLTGPLADVRAAYNQLLESGWKPAEDKSDERDKTNDRS